MNGRRPDPPATARVARDEAAHEGVPVQGVPDDTDRVSRIRKRLEGIGALETLRRLTQKHGTSQADLLGTNRTPRICRARHELWTLVRHTLAMSYPELARLFEVDHTSAIHAVKKREAEMEAGL